MLKGLLQRIFPRTRDTDNEVFFSLLQLYLITSTPITAFPYVFPDFSKRIELFVLPWIFPFVQVTAFEKQEGSLSWPGAIFFQYCIYNLSITLILFVHSDLYYPHINVHFTILIPGFRSSRPLWPPNNLKGQIRPRFFEISDPKNPLDRSFRVCLLVNLGTCQNPLSPKPHIFFYLFMTRASASGNNHDQTWEPLTPTAVIKMSNHIMRRRKHISWEKSTRFPSTGLLTCGFVSLLGSRLCHMMRLKSLPNTNSSYFWNWLNTPPVGLRHCVMK